jgi:hypothetical protein
MIKNNRFKIKTTEGYKKFAGLAESQHNSYLNISFTNGETVKCSKDHVFWTYNNDLIKASDLLAGFDLKSENGIMEISEISTVFSENTMFDVIEVNSYDNNFILTNSLKTHNCQFITFEKSLIDTDVLDFYQTPAIFEEINGFKIFKNALESADDILIITIDPSAGGDDSSVIQLWEIAPHKVYEIASLTDADADASVLFEKLLWLQAYMKTKWDYESDESLIIFERNGIGEGLAQILTQTEKAIENLEMPIFYDNKGKPGLHTTPTTKNKLALQFKNLVEYDKMIINDSEFIDELYGFIRNRNGSYSGKSGYHDDKVTCAFLMVYYLMNIFADFAQGEFSVDNMLLVKQKDKIVNNDKIEHDPAVLYRERIKKEAEEKAKSDAELIEEAKKAEREMYAKQAQMGSSIIEEENDEDEWDIDSYDILPTTSL